MSEQNEKLKATLHMVPIKILVQIIHERRQEIYHETEMDEDQKYQFENAMKVVSLKTELSSDLILGNSRETPNVKARWELYCILYDRNWTLGAIAGATGHDYWRVSNGLRRMGRMPSERGKKEAVI